MSMVKDQKTAERLVRDYLKAQGGEDSGFKMDEAELELVERIVGALGHARREERQPRPPLGNVRR